MKAFYRSICRMLAVLLLLTSAFPSAAAEAAVSAASTVSSSYTFTQMTPVTMYTAHSVNVRNQPALTGDIIRHLAESVKVTVTGKCKQTGWYRITLNDGTVGYSSARFFTADKPAGYYDPTEDAEPVAAPLAIPEHSSSGSFTTDLGDTIEITRNGAVLESYICYDPSIATVSDAGVLTPIRAGQTLVSGISDGTVYYFDIYIYDRHRTEGMTSVKREITDDLWLTADYKIDSKTTLVRSTGLRLVETTATGYIVTYGDYRFEVAADQVTDTCPAATPTPELPNTNYDVKPGMLVDYNYVIPTTGDANGLVSLAKAKTTTALGTDSGTLLQAEAVEPLCKLAIACTYYTGVEFYVKSSGGYRTFQLQNTYWTTRLAANPAYGDDPYNTGGTRCVPGISSEHRTGYAVDISSESAGYTWLNENSWKYGFIHRYTGDKTIYTGVMDEYWHYTYVGRDIAETCYKEGLCLEEYYEKYVFVTLDSEADSSGSDIRINKTEAALETGSTLKLKLTNALGTVSWSSSDKSVAKVSKKGKVTGISAGTAVISAECDGLSFSCIVTVTDPAAEEEAAVTDDSEAAADGQTSPADAADADAAVDGQSNTAEAADGQANAAEAASEVQANGTAGAADLQDDAAD